MVTFTSEACTSYDYTLLDGYGWMEQQAQSIHGPLHAIAEYGEWPYTAAVRGRRGDSYIIKTYSEHEVHTWIYELEEREQYAAHLTQLRENAQ